MPRSHPLRRRWLAVASALAMSAAVAGCGGSSSSSGGGDGQATLKFSYMAGEQTSIGQLWTWWLDEVEKRSAGSLKFDRYWDATLLKATETIEGLKDGRADVSQVLPTVYAGRFPLTSVGELPFESSNAPAVSEALATFGADEAHPVRKEWEQQGLVPLSFSIGASSALSTKDPVRSAADLRGKRIRANDRGSRVMQSAGANLVNIELAEIYGSVERGLVNGVYGIPFSFVGPLKFPEVAKHFTDLGIGVSTVNSLAISKKRWDGLTPEQQKVIQEVNAETPKKIAEIEAQFDDVSCKAVKAAGGELTVLPDAEVQKISAAGKAGVDAAWKKDVKGTDADAFYTEYKAKVAAAEKKYSDYQTGVKRCAASGSSSR
ncbi:TRAP transporter substrate-binding protein DctP [Patulibacter sp.]|uniref:TRAP transporter substrate-binding protein DctP n=1 Tax=Patulibacter sp. TaxID=1912859 RepID=UPI00271A1060|nr:TRAP transporter substrate-binding protein DctP [Patulibacter sp.]MDO9407694.1 TRAP transporter substrate-binding protein DctP [Patulibacter sp.]